MATNREIRNKLIDSIMAIDNHEFLVSLQNMISSSNIEKTKIPLNEAQKLMLLMSDDDINNQRLIDQDALTQQELEWLSRK